MNSSESDPRGESAAPERFVDRLHAVVDRKESCLVVGLDPDIARLPPDVRSMIGERTSGGEGLTAKASAAIGLFFDHVLDAVRESAVAVKPNCAFFERYGASGWDCLRHVCAAARARELLVILDAKRGDIGHSAEAYADGLFGDQPDTPGAHVDAITLNPYLGTDSVAPFLARARTHGRGIFALVRTSNRSAGELQDLVADGRPFHLHVAEQVAQWGRELDGDERWTSVGAVVGATAPESAAAIRAALPGSPFLVPGIGAQGGRPEDLEPYFSGGYGALVSASRSILYAYEGKSRPWIDSIRAEAESTRERLERVRRG